MLIMTGAEILRGPQDVDISIPAIYYITTATSYYGDALSL